MIKDDEKKEGKKKSFSLTKGSNFADYGLGIFGICGRWFPGVLVGRTKVT